jgi:transcriptional regulator with XRE-family HTH domain
MGRCGRELIFVLALPTLTYGARGLQPHEVRKGYNKMTKLATTIGATIRESRTALGETQTEIARRVRVPRCRISEYERGRTLPNVLHLIRLADALGIRTLDLLVGRKFVKRDWTRKSKAPEAPVLEGDLIQVAPLGERKQGQSVRKSPQGYAEAERLPASPGGASLRLLDD